MQSTTKPAFIVLLLVVVAGALSLKAQTGPRPAPPPPGTGATQPADVPAKRVLKGVVLDGDSLQPLPGVEIVWTPAASRGPQASGTSPKPISVRTDTDGAFEIDTTQGGQLEFKKEGYIQSGGLDRMPNTIPPYILPPTPLTPRPASAAVRRIILYRANAIRGQVVDEELKAPVKGLKIRAGLATYRRGQRFVSTAATATTDAEGRFALTGLPPGDYCLQTFQEAGMEGGLILQPSKEQIGKVARGYAAAYWPKARDPEGAAVIPLSSGAETNLGTIRITRQPLYAALLSLSAASCKAGDIISLTVSGAAISTRSEIPCGQPVLTSDLQPGRYGVEAWVRGRQREEREYLSHSFDVIDRNLSLSLPLTRGADVSGKVVLPSDNYKASLGEMTISLSGGPLLMSADGSTERPNQAAVDAEGNFKLASVWFREYSIVIPGLTQSLYVKRISYNGTAIKGSTLALNRAYDSHSLEIILGDKPASVFGQVTDRNEPLKGSRVALISWPADPESIHSSSTFANTDEQGRYSFSKVVPGEYHIFAVAATDSDKLDRPKVMDELAKSAQKLELSDGNSRSVPLEPLRP